MTEATINIVRLADLEVFLVPQIGLAKIIRTFKLIHWHRLLPSLDHC